MSPTSKVLPKFAVGNKERFCSVSHVPGCVLWNFGENYGKNQGFTKFWCGFFGTGANMNLCSQWYRDQLKADEQSSLAKAAFEKSANPKRALTTTQEESVFSSDFSVAYEIGASPSSASSDSATSTSNGESGIVAKNRCFSCKKKLGLTADKCKCGPVFCSAHPYPEKHSCEFDYQGVGRDILAKLNPQAIKHKTSDQVSERRRTILKQKELFKHHS
ncbi:zinc finger A20 and AN1 domain-containing stress-associated protein 1-like [Papaver somniferum]|uniref:zinc finger A20 and AN1 domain-containing stress-associated protein 1-like n=1 Tax=Papaver somniferum TaxID=3469 RepID=UPI000E6F8C5F|nr:zinc finger A20 and AN1 domain-containing stress-associated protein 1-like [Papaver somniferum]